MQCIGGLRNAVGKILSILQASWRKLWLFQREYLFKRGVFSKIYRDMQWTGIPRTLSPQLQQSFIEKGREYREAQAFIAADCYLELVLKKSPDNLEALMEYARTAYARCSWQLSVKRHSQLLHVLTGQRGDREREALWLYANKKMIVSLLNQKRYREVKKHRYMAFQRLGGRRDLIQMMKPSCGLSREDRVKTAVFIKGLSAFYTCSHQLLDHQLSVMEKCCIPNSREPMLYEKIKEQQLFEENPYVLVPPLLGVVKRENYIKLFMGAVKGTPIKEIPLTKIDFFTFGRALGEISRELTAAFPAAEAPVYPIRTFPHERALQIFKDHGERERVRHAVEMLEEFFSKIQEVLDLLEGIPKFFCHNDTGAQNVFFMGENSPYAFIDWERAAYNGAGSDLGNVLRWKPFKEAQRRGLAQEVESLMVEGYLSSLKGVCSHLTREEVMVSYHFHFINGKLKTAVNRSNFNLFYGIARRSGALLQLLGL